MGTLRQKKPLEYARTQLGPLTLWLTLVLAIAVPAKPQTSKLKFVGARDDYSYTGGFAIGDFNGDGFPDIATSNASSLVVILLNDGTGHYNQASSLPGSPGQYFVVGDFNNDGLLDVAFTAYGFVDIALGAGDGTLRNLFQISSGSTSDLTAVDLNADGNLDLVVGGYSISCFLGFGDGTLGSPLILRDIQSPFAVADLNGDNKPDIVGVYGTLLAVELNSGDGTFAPGPTTAYSGTGAYGLAVGDLDGNSTADLVLSTQNPSLITIFKGDGQGAFTKSSSIALPLLTDHVALLDVNGDGKLDLLYDKFGNSHLPATNLNIQLGNGDATFGSASAYATAGAGYRIAQADTRKSGQLDLLTGGYQQFSILPSKGPGIFNQGSFFRLSGVLQSAVSADFNHDGIQDLLVSVRLSASAPSSNVNPGTDVNSQFAGAYVLLGTGDPIAPFALRQRFFVPPDVLGVTTADFNNDGSPDLAFVTGKNLVIYMGAGDGTFTAGAQYPCPCFNVTTADFNGDGKPDIATSGVYIYLGKGDGTFGKPTLPFAGGNAYLGAADLNGDGKADLVTVQPNSSAIVIGFGTGAGTFETTSSAGVNGVLSGVLADFDHDGHPDLALLSGSSVFVYLNKGKGIFLRSSQLGIGYSSSANTIAAADFDHDGFMDIATPGLDMIIYAGAGNGTFAPPAYFGAANYPNVILANDFYDFGPGQQPDLIGIGQNGAISTLFNKSH